MKNISFLMILLALTFVSHAQTQTYPTPEYTNLPYFFDKSSGKLIALEKTTAKMESKTKAMGYGGSEGGYKIDGDKSFVVLKQSDTMEFVMTANSMMNMMDPGQMISLYQLKIEKADRMAVMQENKGMFGKSSHDDSKISFLEKKADDKMVLVVPKKLAPGEYSFISMMNMSGGMSFDAFCFRIE
ncbi:MAG: hypothetical protein ACHQD9_07910 [Chitinophagales bacterium]